MATGEIRYIATIDTSAYKRGANDIDNSNQDIERSTERTAERSNKSLNAIAKIGIAAIVTAAVAAGAIIVSNIGGAITRIDTLNNSARVFKNLGFNADDVTEAMDKLQQSILGLPTSLDSAVRGTQDLAATYGDIRLGQKVFSALNNAILSTGGSSDEVQNAIRQLSQVPLDGPLDAQTWLSLRNSGLTPVLVTLSKEFGRSISQLKEDFSSGELTVQDFVDALIKLDEQGGGGVASLQTQVKDATKGIETSFANLNTAIQRNIANLFESFGVENISGAIQSVTTNIDNLGKTINGIVKQYVVPFVAELQKVFSVIFSNQDVAEGLKIILLGVGIAFGIIIAAIALVAIGAVALTAVIGFLIGLLVKAIIAVVEFANSFTSAFTKLGQDVDNSIRNAFIGLFGFFRDLWNNIVTLFSSVGTAVGNAIGNAVKSVINTVIRQAIGLINGFIDSINGIVDLINRIPGVNLGKLGRLPVPQLANGGIVMPTAGGTLANIAEAGKPEAVIPLDKLDEIIKNGGGNESSSPKIEINVSGAVVTSPQDQRRLAEVIGKRLNEIMQQKGYQPAIEGL